MIRRTARVGRWSRRAGLFASLVPLLVQTGCATVPTAAKERSPGRVGLVAAEYFPEIALDVPGKGRMDGAVRGAGRGFVAGAYIPLRIGAEGLKGCSGDACGAAAVVLLALAAAGGTVGAVVGGVDGAIHAMPAREARTIEAATLAHADRAIQEAVRERTAAEARARDGCGPVHAFPGGPAATDCAVDYAGWSRRGVDTVVETSVVRAGLKGEAKGSDPPLSPFLDVRTRLIDAADGSLLAERRFAFVGARRPFAAWSAGDGAALKEEFLRGYDVVAARIATELVCAPRAAGPPGKSFR